VQSPDLPRHGLHVSLAGPSLVVALAGEHDFSTVPLIEDKIRAAVEGQPSVIFDLSAATYIDSSVLRLLVNNSKTLGERMSVVAATPNVRRILAVSGVDAFIRCVGSITEALDLRESGAA